jgi:hypothetical protein
MILCMQSGFATDSEISAAAAGWLLDSAILGGKWWGVHRAWLEPGVLRGAR